MKRYKDQLAVVSGLLDETLKAIASAREIHFTPPEYLLLELQAYAAAQRNIAAVAGGTKQASQTQSTEEQIQREIADRQLSGGDMHGLVHGDYVYWTEEEWMCPVCKEEDLVVNPGTTRDQLRPVKDSPWFASSSIECSCIHCGYNGTVGQAAMSIFRERFGYPPLPEIQSLRDRL